MAAAISRPGGVSTDDGIDQFFTFSRRELTVIARRRGPLNRLSVGLQIGFLRMAGRMLNSFQPVR